MVDWVTKGRPPPPIALSEACRDGTLVPATSAAMGWPNIPNSPKPDGVMNSVLDYDFGPQLPLQRRLRRHRQRAAAGEAGDPDARAEGRRRRQRDRGHQVAADAPAARNVHGVESDRERSAQGSRGVAVGGLCSVRQDEGRAPRERRLRDCRSRSGTRACGSITSTPSTRRTSWSQERFLLPDDAAVLINQLLNNMLASNLLPKRIGVGVEQTMVAVPDEEEAAEYRCRRCREARAMRRGRDGPVPRRAWRRLCDRR